MTEKMTQKLALTYVLENCELPVDVYDKLNAMLGAVTKKNGGAKQTEKQEKNAKLGELVVEFMAGKDPMTVNDIFKGLGDAFTSHSHANSIVSALKRDGTLIREEVKGRAYFKVA